MPPVLFIEKPPVVMKVLTESMRKNFLFRHLDEAKLGEIVGLMSELTVRVGDEVIREGTTGDYFYVAESGGFDVIVKGECVHKYEVSKEEGKHPSFGELALMYAKPRAATVVATDDGVLWRLGRTTFRAVQEQASGTDPYRVLSKVAFFSSLRYDQVQRLRDRMREIKFEAREVIFSQGEVGDGMYIIVKGQVSVLKLESGSEREVMTLGENAYFGERALLRDEPRAATIVAIGSVKTLFISRTEFESVLGSLQKLLDDDRRKREQAASARTIELDAAGLANVTRESFRLEAPIARLPCGAFYLATHVAKGECYTLRQETKQAVAAASEQERLQREVGLLRAIGDVSALPFLPSLLRAFESVDSVYLLYKRRAVCTVDSLLDLGPLDDRRLQFVGANIIAALEVLHGQLRVVYRNVMLDNLSLFDDGYICLMDFRFCCHASASSRTLCGSPLYFSPEMVRGEVQTPACDIWSLGVLLFELTEGEPPWGTNDTDDMAVLRRIAAHTHGSLRVPARVAGSSGEDVTMPLLNQLMHPQPDGRFGGSAACNAEGANELRDHAFFQSLNWSKLLDGDIESPLQDHAREQLSRRMADVDWEEPELEPFDEDEIFLPE